jgi:hypothetical protein
MDALHYSIIEALMALITRDRRLIETQPKEECINHKFAQHLEEALNQNGLLNGYDVDVEYDKYKENMKKSSSGNNIRPDIIVHERGSGNNKNLIVIEAKKNYLYPKDRKKVKDLVTNNLFNYKLGALISYLPESAYIRISFLNNGSSSWNIYRLYKDNFQLKKIKNEPL